MPMNKSDGQRARRRAAKASFSALPNPRTRANCALFFTVGDARPGRPSVPRTIKIWWGAGTHSTPSLPAPLCSHFSVAAARKVRGFCWRPGSDDATLVLGSRFLYRRTGLLLCHAGKHHPLSNFGRSWLLLPDGSLLGVRGRNCGCWKLATPCPPSSAIARSIELGNFPLQDGLLLSQLAGDAVALFPAYQLFATCVLPLRHIRACYSWARGAWQRGCRLCGG